MSKRLSVIIPGYNTPDGLWRRCVSSVLNATCDDDEIICVDDGSTKAKMPIFDNPRVRQIYLEENCGQACARNKALDIAKGEWVAFVDSDDEIVPDIYERGIAKLKETGRDIVAFGIDTVYLYDGLEGKSELGDNDIGVLTQQWVKYFIKQRLFDEPVNKIYRRSFLEENHIRFPNGVCPGEDTMFILDCVLHNATWATINGHGYIYYRMDGTTLSRYLGNYVDTLRYWKVKWDEYLSTIGSGYDGWWPTKNYSEEWVASMQWENIWRRNSPWKLRDKWAYLKQHPSLCKPFAIYVLLKKVLHTFMRLHCYWRPIRRWHLKRTWPHLKNLTK